MIHKLRIGNVELDNNVFLAPMAGITDKPFRIICKGFGAGLICSEMISSRAIAYNDKKTIKMLNTEGEKRPISVQIFGNTPEIMKKAATYAKEYADIIDINAGCPAPKVVKNGDGSKLLTDLDLLGKIIYEVKKTVNIPVTVKMRVGWDKKNIVLEDAVRVIEKAGADAITVHGRTREDYFSGQNNLELIKRAKQIANIPIIGNGDIKNLKDAKNMIKKTDVDGVMIGRAALGNPWIFEELISCKERNISNKERLNIILKHIDLEILEKGENIGIKEMRKHICWYIKKLPESSKIRNKINSLNTRIDVEKTLIEYLK